MYSLQPDDTKPPFAYMRPLGETKFVEGERLSSCTPVHNAKTPYRIVLFNHFKADVKKLLRDIIELGNIPQITISAFSNDALKISKMETNGEVPVTSNELYVAIDIFITGPVHPFNPASCNTSCESLENPLCK